MRLQSRHLAQPQSEEQCRIRFSLSQCRHLYSATSLIRSAFHVDLQVICRYSQQHGVVIEMTYACIALTTKEISDALSAATISGTTAVVVIYVEIIPSSTGLRSSADEASPLLSDKHLTVFSFRDAVFPEIFSPATARHFFRIIFFPSLGCLAIAVLAAAFVYSLSFADTELVEWLTLPASETFTEAVFVRNIIMPLCSFV